MNDNDDSNNNNNNNNNNKNNNNNGYDQLALQNGWLTKALFPVGTIVRGFHHFKLWHAVRLVNVNKFP